ncbi:MAG: glycoside hydrolase family 2 protein [Oscillospiraceae bacterium]|nr:glycoside hydrolase family 2 protein [Oscillospiraceae bacterium]
MMTGLCNGWEFTQEWTEAFGRGEGTAEAVRLPHTAAEMPLHYGDHKAYQMVCGYRRTITADETMRSKRLFLQFDGAAHIATVYFNGTELATHRCGYTAFRVEITDHVRFGQENRIAVRLDTTENPEIPPFGYVIDYLTYGGLYREVWLDVRGQEMVSDVFVTTPDLTTVCVRVTADSECRVEILSETGEILDAQNTTEAAEFSIPDALPWSIDAPNRYLCRVTNRSSGDQVEVKFGFRTAEFKADGFYLNGEKTFLRGLNRHQCYPYVGYAAPEALQREDARILKYELGCTAVRTSHYPQSHYFIDECDRLGLLVFTEIPGWQHLGDEGWKEQACENVKEMVTQYRNHPSIILWGVRINESIDDDALYRRTNAIARSLDPSRATSGVRYLQKSSLLEDVYAYNDFSHTGSNAGAMAKKAVTPNKNKSYLISEHNGHMFPTKAFDPWQKRQEHALRHAKVLDAAVRSGEHAGCFGWCMFDYPTHKDFGSGDRVCYHGVMDAFRNPKLAAAVYASQKADTPVLEVGCPMDIGDYAGGNIGDIYVFTNAEEVCLYKNGNFVSKLVSHSPGVMKVEDTVGCLLETQESFSPKKAQLLRKCLVTLGKKGVIGLSPADYIRMGWAMVRYKITMDEAVQLYGKYIGNWGGEATVWRFDAQSKGEVVASATRCPSAALHLEVKASHTVLNEGCSYDIAAVRVRILDEFGNTASYAQLPVRFKLEGPARLVGPEIATAEGGMCGTYIRTTGIAGEVKLTVSTGQIPPVTVHFTVNA